MIRSTDAAITGSKYRLWTTLKVPQGFSMAKHCEFLCRQTGALSFKLMPAKKLFALGVGHVRRRGMEPGSKSDELAEVLDTNIVELNELEWRVLVELKREFTILLIEHDMETVFALADRITVLVYGRVIASGPPDAIRANAEVRQAYLGEQDSHG